MPQLRNMLGPASRSWGPATLLSAGVLAMETGGTLNDRWLIKSGDTIPHYATPASPPLHPRKPLPTLPSLSLSSHSCFYSVWLVRDFLKLLLLRPKRQGLGGCGRVADEAWRCVFTGRPHSSSSMKPAGIKDPRNKASSQRSREPITRLSIAFYHTYRHWWVRTIGFTTILSQPSTWLRIMRNLLHKSEGNH
jgi:hypothetical protein